MIEYLEKIAELEAKTNTTENNKEIWDLERDDIKKKFS